MVPLYEDVKLRTSDVLGDFADTFVLEHRYGDLSKTKIRLGKLSDTLYFVADHPMASVDSVQEAGQEIKAWRWFTKADKAGVTSTYVELAQPVSRVDGIVTASGRGKLNTVTGALIENPADIITDIAAINGREVLMPYFREECERRGLKFAGSLDEVKSLRLYLMNVIDSIGGLLIRDDAIIYPTSIGYAKRITSFTPPSFRATTEQRAGSVKVAYNYNEGSGKYGSFVVVGAINSPYDNQRVEYCKWLRSNTAAIELATRLCKYYAGEHVEVTTEVAGIHHTGDPIWLEGAFFETPFLVTESQPQEASTRVKGDLIVNSWDAVEVTNYSAELPITQQEGIELEFDNGLLTITIYDTENKPFVGAFVSLDKGTPKKTNSRGRVQFRTTPGGHVLDIAAPGFDSINNLPINVQ